jgi:DNA-binding XRE family transcriptional regulator
MLQSSLSQGRVLSCPHCHLCQVAKVTCTCRRCRRPLPVSYVEFCIPSTLTAIGPSDPESLRHFIGHALRRMRLRRGWSQLRLSAAIGTHRTHISRVETGRVAPAPALLVRAAVALGITRFLVFGSTEEARKPGGGPDPGL